MVVWTFFSIDLPVLTYFITGSLCLWSFSSNLPSLPYLWLPWYGHLGLHSCLSTNHFLLSLYPNHLILLERKTLKSHLKFFKKMFVFGCAESWLLWGLFSSCGEQGLLSRGGAHTSHWGVFSHYGAQTLGRAGLSSCSSQALEHRLNSCGTWAWVLQGMWDLPRPGTESVL